MRLRIYIDMGNAAFDEYPMSEAARILREYADRIEQSGEPDANLRDINGNTVGAAVSEKR